jgi:hypothetical protein
VLAADTAIAAVLQTEPEQKLANPKVRLATNADK